jgi:hypothetical protein
MLLQRAETISAVPIVPLARVWGQQPQAQAQAQARPQSQAQAQAQAHGSD